MDNVKVHYNSSHPMQLNALAYAKGSDIHVAPGQEDHLPHEAWHIVQQAQGRVQSTMQMKDGVPVNDDAGLEHEADVMGEKAIAYEGRQCYALRPPTMPASCNQSLRRFPPVIQRRLAVQNTVVVQDIASIIKLDTKVWLLQGRENDELVIKAERSPVTPDRAAPWLETMFWLGQIADIGQVPNVSRLTQQERANIASHQLVEQNKATGAGAKGIDLKTLCSNLQKDDFLIKVDKVKMGENLQSRYEAGQKEQREKVQRMSRVKGKENAFAMLTTEVAGAGLKDMAELLANPIIIFKLGRIAAYDMVLNSHDRFRPDGTANAKNIDFTKGEIPIALDNWDPYNRLGGPQDPTGKEWQWAKIAQTKEARAQYGQKVVGYLVDTYISKSSPTDLENAAIVMSLVEDFNPGIESGVQSMKGVIGTVVAERLTSTVSDPNKAEALSIIEARLRYMQG